ncbi:MAG: SIMPL domain-containing protein [Bacteriovoracaceae bacterium]|jgi:uncharacterized protein YggE
MKFFLVAALFSTSSFAATSFVNVTGKCQMKVIPDQASLAFTAEALEKDQQKAVNKITVQTKELTDKIKELKLKGMVLETSNYNVHQQRDWENNKMVDKGYRASVTITVTSNEISRMGEAMVLGSKVGITNVGNLRSFLSLEKEQAEYLKCLDIAAEDARGKADQLAKKLKAKVGDVLEIYERPQQSSPSPVYERTMMAMKGASDTMASIPVEAGEQVFSTQIEVKFSLK